MTSLYIIPEANEKIVVEKLLETLECTSRRTSRRAKVDYPLHLNAIKTILKFGVHINSRDKNGFTALHFATERGHKDVVKLLLHCGAKDDPKEKYVDAATETICKDVVEVLLEMLQCGTKRTKRAKLDSKDDGNIAPLHFEAIKMILKFGAHIDSKAKNFTRRTALHFATELGHRDVVKLLLDCGAKVNFKDVNNFTPLHLGAKKGSKEIVETLLRFGAHINSRDLDGRTALHFATKDAHIEIVELLLECGAKVDCKDTYENTPLHWSIENRYQKTRQKIIKKLLEFGANINSSDEDGETALHFAAKDGLTEIVELLLECGARVDSRDEEFETPLHRAAEFGSKEIIKTLLKYGIDINSKDIYNQTALQKASGRLHADVVAALLQYGSDINVTGVSGWTPFEYACYACYYECQDNDDDCLCGETTKVLIRHIVKMKTTNLYVSDRNLVWMNKHKFRNFLCACEEEIVRMKSSKINNTNISFFGILTKGTSSVATYLRNDYVVRVLKSKAYKKAFPIYASDIESNFEMGKERKNLLEQGIKIFQKIFCVHFNKFPQLNECSEKIFTYLSDRDLRIFIGES